MSKIAKTASLRPSTLIALVNEARQAEAEHHKTPWGLNGEERVAYEAAKKRYTLAFDSLREAMMAARGGRTATSS